ncbi:NAD-dependent epimerase/dehydratase family protein [Sneathiella sp. P13V-1]|uniref:SDR family oxidoreductase n=1 Tax=Sneathiella sp. P13V-1 TaxID=2697366 RepID=UPI00187B62FC|nr:SDR family oxidoreductase [Sneathiella sp. P13V-1]MBE7635896.1 NAD-dependent epimerase/dehydratase family protein [Sneathiella sp. P13V-1]
MNDPLRIMVTGAAGMVGQHTLQYLAKLPHTETLATDIAPPKDMPENIRFEKMDVTTDDPEKVISSFKPDVILHLASVVTPPKGTGREFAYKVDVEGTRKVIEAAIYNKTRRIVVTSSGAAYGYHEDNPDWLNETHTLRGNAEFPYSDHKRQVEEMLAVTRHSYPELEQVILRVGTVLGEKTDNQITALFQRPKLLAIKGSESPFVFIWLDDLAKVLVRAATDGPEGVFNVAGDGAMGVNDLSAALKKPIKWLPAWAVKLALGIAKPLGLSRYGPEQVRFLQYRPVLDNTALKEEFGFTPEHTSREAFERWQKGMGL